MRHGARPIPVSPLEGAKFIFSNSNFSATAAGIATVLSLQCAPLGFLYSAPTHWGPMSPLWGSGPPTENLHFWTVTFFEVPEISIYIIKREMLSPEPMAIEAACQ